MARLTTCSALSTKLFVILIHSTSLKVVLFHPDHVRYLKFDTKRDHRDVKLLSFDVPKCKA